MKFKETTYSGIKEILKHKDFNAIPVMVDDVGIDANDDGKKIVSAGTIVGGKTVAVLQNPQEPVVKKNTTEAEGVLLYDVDVTYGKAPGSMVTRGTFDIDKVTQVEAPSLEAINELSPRILFIK